MATTTTGGRKYPVMEDTDPLRDVAAALRALAQAVDVDMSKVLGQGGLYTGVTNVYGQFAIPHTLGVVPSVVTVVSSSEPNTAGDAAVQAGKDYLPVVYSVTENDIIVRWTNLRVDTWAGENNRMAVRWFARA